MVNISKFGDSAIKFTFTDSNHYLYGDGEITVPVNALLLVIDESDMATFKKQDGDVFISFNINDSNFNSKEDLITFYKENMTGGGGLPVEDIEQIVDDKIEEINPITGVSNSGSKITYQKVNRPWAVTKLNTVAGKTLVNLAAGDSVDNIDVVETSAFTQHVNDSNVHVTANEKSAWDNKSDFSGNYNDLSNKPTIPTNVSELYNDANYLNTARLADYNYVTESEVSGIVDSKQDILVSGTNIKTVNGESLVGSGNIIIDSGATPIVIDGALDSGSTNPVANSAITEALKVNEHSAFEQSSQPLILYGHDKSFIVYTTNSHSIHVYVYFNGFNSAEEWMYSYLNEGWTFSCTQTPLDSPHYTCVNINDYGYKFIPKNDGYSINYVEVKNNNNSEYAAIVAETDDVVPEQSITDRVEALEERLVALNALNVPFLTTDTNSKVSLQTLRFSPDTGEIVKSYSQYGLFGYDAKTFSWKDDGTNSKLTFTKYIIDEDVLLKTAPNKSIDVSQIMGEETFDSYQYHLKLWVIKTNADYSQDWGDMNISIRTADDSSMLGDFSIRYDRSRGLTIEGMGEIRERWEFKDFKFGDTVVVDMNGLFGNDSCKIRIRNWDGDNGMVSSIGFYNFYNDSYNTSAFIINFDDWQKSIQKKLVELDEKEEVIARALHELRSMIEDLQNNNANR